MSVRFTVGKFPEDSSCLDSSGLPWGCVLQPFAMDLSPAARDPAPYSLDPSASHKSKSPAILTAFDPTPLPRADDVARCEECFGYINPYCAIDWYSWRCSLCGVVNSFTDAQAARYENKRATQSAGELPSVESVPEVSRNLVDLDVAVEEEVHGDHQQFSGQQSADANGGCVGNDGEYLSEKEMRERPVYIALVDVAGGEEFLELVKSSLLAALEALPPAALFGLATFSRKVGFGAGVMEGRA